MIVASSPRDTPTPETDGLPPPQRIWAILTVLLALTMAVLDGAIANVALPTIAHDLASTAVTSIWVVNAYQLAITIALLPLASLGDIFGYRRVYGFGLLVFTIGSLACALSGTMAMLTMARVVQGLGAAGIMSVNSALVRFIYPRSQFGRGVGFNALVIAVCSAIGPTVASGILAIASWPWLFAVNVPIGVVALTIGIFALPRSPLSGHRFDAASAVMSAFAFGLAITGIEGFAHGEGLALVAAELSGAVVFGFALVRRQLDRPSPLLPVDLLRLPIFRLSVITSICSFVAQMLAYVSLPFYLQTTLGRTQVETGLLMTPWPLATAVMAPIAGRLADRYSAGILGGIGLALLAAGLGSLAMLPLHPGVQDIVWRMALCGAGFGLFQSPNNRAMIASAPRDRSGGAGGALAMARLLGQTTGAALVALMFSRFPVQGAIIALAVGAGFAVMAGAISCLRLTRAGRPQTAPMAHPSPLDPAD